MKPFSILLLAQILAAQIVTVPVPSQYGAINTNFAFLDISKLSYSGNWSATATYSKPTIVTYSSVAYVSLQTTNNLNRQPSTQPTYWRALASGAAGPQGPVGAAGPAGPIGLTGPAGAVSIPIAIFNPLAVTCPLTGSIAIFSQQLWVCLSAGSFWERVATTTALGTGVVEFVMGEPPPVWPPAGSKSLFIGTDGVLKYISSAGVVQTVK